MKTRLRSTSSESKILENMVRKRKSTFSHFTTVAHRELDLYRFQEWKWEKGSDNGERYLFVQTMDREIGVGLSKQDCANQSYDRVPQMHLHVILRNTYTVEP